MRERLKVFISLIIFWLSFMMVARAWFLGYNYDLTANLTFGEIVLSMLHGLQMDASISGYILAMSGLLLTISVLIRGSWVYYTFTTTTLIFLLASCILVMVDMELYRHWGFRMNTAPLLYMGSEGIGSVAPWLIAKLLLILLLLFSTFSGFYFRWIAPRIRSLKTTSAKSAVVLIIVTGLMFLPIRGSFSVAPMNTGFVYFHNSKPYANHAAINVVWNFLYSVRKSASIEYPENFYDADKSKALFSSLYPKSDSTINLFTSKRPNIILIILESFTADVVEPLGGVEGITPHLNKLCKEGILFTNFYASGDRTDKGLISILSGYPAQPQTSIIKFPAKSQRLPHLNHYIKRLGYRTSFIYGGDIDFANFRSYLNTGGFDHLTSMDDFDDDLNKSKWGVHDHFMFEKAQQELDTTHNTFFKVILTLSSHEPFDVPMQPKFKGHDDESLFLNSCYYTDKSLGNFIDYCKKQTWWNNTVVVITADHGHRSPRNKELKDKERFRIPLLMIGGAVPTDTTINILSNQTDIANTLLAQIDKPYPEFHFSKNIMANNVVSFSAYFFNDGYGFLMPGTYIIHDNPGKQFLNKEGATQQQIELSKAYQQILYTDYNKK